VVSGSVVPVRRTRERGAASLGLIGECPPAVEDPGNLAGALALRSGRNRVLAWGRDAPGPGASKLRDVRAAIVAAATAIEFSLCRL